MTRGPVAKRAVRRVWFRIERIPAINYLALYPVSVGYGREVAKLGGGFELRHVLWRVHDGAGDLCYVREEFDRSARFIADKAIANPVWLAGNNQIVLKTADRYLAAAKALEQVDPRALSNRQLTAAISRLLRIQNVSHHAGQVATWLIDADHQHFSSYLLQYLRDLPQAKRAGDAEVGWFSQLTTPRRTSFTDQEQQETLALALRLSQDPVARQALQSTSLVECTATLHRRRPKLWVRLVAHQQSWCWLHYNYRGPLLEMDYFLQIWRGLLREGLLARKLQASRTRLRTVARDQARLVQRLQIDPRHRRLLALAADIVWLKAYRKDCMYFGSYVLNRFIAELSQRAGLTFAQAEYMTPQELRSAITKPTVSARELTRRRTTSIILGSWDDTKVLTGQAMQRFIRQQAWEQPKKLDGVITGQPACPGRATGVVKIVETAEDIPKMRRGDIMLSETTYPALVPAMKMAAAIVTNVGGLTCHAAIVARELKIPCVVGTKVATHILQDGDRVRVDATKGIIRKL